MYDYELRLMMEHDRFESLRKSARRRPAPVPTAVETTDIELRLCKAADDDGLETLAALSEQQVPSGRLVVALVDGRLVAALPLAGGCALRDPFVSTQHLIGLLELRAKQLREPAPRPMTARLLRRHA